MKTHTIPFAALLAAYAVPAFGAVFAYRVDTSKRGRRFEGGGH
jgi:hypothetical protein